MRNKSQRAQAVVELAVFGGLVLFLSGMLLSYMQSQNDAQYTEMEAFRRTLEKACTYQGEDEDGAGASARMTLFQNRRNVNLADDFQKRSSQEASGSADVFWAIPKLGTQPQNLQIFRINENERQWRKNMNTTDEEGNVHQIEGDPPFDQEDGTHYVKIEDRKFQSDLNFREETNKLEDTQQITNMRISRIKEQLNTTIPYSIRHRDDINATPEDSDPVLSNGTLWNIAQRLYTDTDNPVNPDAPGSSYEYKYSSNVTQGYEVVRSKTWETPFSQ